MNISTKLTSINSKILLCILALFIFPYKSHSSVQVVAHRGASGYAPENTISSIRKAIELGSHFVEIDVHMTSDSKVVAIHDKSVDRTTNGTGDVAEYSLKELKNLDAGSWYSKKFTGEKIPTLREVFEEVKGETRLIIEFKYGHKKYNHIEEIVAKLIREYGLEGNVILKSFDSGILNRFEEVIPEVERLYCIFGGSKFITLDNFLRFRNVFSISNIQYIQVHKYFLTQRFVNKAHKRGLKVIVWGVNDAKSYLKFTQMRVDMIETDFPDRVSN